jgi:predicted DNA-binding transcriptional regulator AlpA
MTLQRERREAMTNTPTVERLTVDVPTAARMLGISRTLAFQLAARGELPGALKLGGRTVVSVREIECALRGGRDEAA